MSYNLSELFERVADAVPEREAGDVARLAVALGLARWEGTA